MSNQLKIVDEVASLFLEIFCGNPLVSLHCSSKTKCPVAAAASFQPDQKHCKTHTTSQRVRVFIIDSMSKRSNFCSQLVDCISESSKILLPVFLELPRSRQLAGSWEIHEIHWNELESCSHSTADFQHFSVYLLDLLPLALRWSFESVLQGSSRAAWDAICMYRSVDSMSGCSRLVGMAEKCHTDTWYLPAFPTTCCLWFCEIFGHMIRMCSNVPTCSDFCKEYVVLQSQRKWHLTPVPKMARSA